MASDAERADGRKKLTWEQVREIRRLQPLTSQRKLAKKFGVAHSTIGKIIAGEFWKE